MAGVSELAVDSRLLGILDGAGYEYFGEYGIPGRHFFRKGDPRTHHLHWVRKDGDFWRRQILFRDYLRAFPEEAAAYERLKRLLAAAYSTDRDRYTRAKGEFVAGVLYKAGRWRGVRF
jgi:GrpB-like predicted nucleotidyltransferase (UPF0157 family)